MIDWRIWFIAGFFGLVETAYFGWNLTPQSEAELICDGITFVILALGLRPRSNTKVSEGENER